ncbi:MAG: ornithine cyclodeaminase family protein, partial [Pseudomonadota bacterium]
MTLFSARTGALEALLLDNGYLTDVRTAAAGAVAAKHLARADARRALVLGAGMQARLQLTALTLVRPIERAEAWARDADAAARFAQEMSAALALPVAAVEDRAAAARAADVIVTATPATAPLLEADWLSPGCHVTAMGSDQEHKAELAPACLARADLYVPDRRAQTAALGELRAAIAAGVVAADAAFPELGEIVAGAVPGRAPGRAGAAAVTICDLTGTGVQDTAIANEARARADAQGLGVRFEA